MHEARISTLALISMHTSPLAALGGFKTGGMNVYVRELARELGRRGICVDIFTRRDSAALPEVEPALGPNVSVIHVTAGPFGTADPNSLMNVTQEFAAGVHKFSIAHNRSYDLIYANYWLSGQVAEILRRSWNVPLVQMFHTLGAMKNRIARQPMIDPRVIGEMQIVQSADRIIAATHAEYAQLLWLYRADRRKVAIVPPGVNTRRFAPIPRDEARRIVGLNGGEQMLLFVGRLEPLKAVDIIIKALNIIITADPSVLNGVRLTVIGGEAGNPERRRLIALAESLGVAQYVNFVGSKDHSQLPAYYSAAEALLIPSDYESFGMAALEAMTSGTPVIASSVGGLQYLVRDGETGYLVPVRDADALSQRICQVLRNPAQRNRMGANAAELAREYDWSKIADRLLKVFDEAMRVRRQQAGSNR